MSRAGLPSEHGRAMRVLVIDDDPADTRLIARVMEDFGAAADLIVATDGEEALARLRQEGAYADTPRPDVILLDPSLRAPDGREMLGELETDPELSRIPVIVLAGATGNEAATSAHLASPGAAHLEHLVDVIRALEGLALAQGARGTAAPGGSPSALHALLAVDAPAEAQAVVESLAEAQAGAPPTAHIALTWVDTLERALRRIASGDIDVLLLDLALPDSRGVATLFAILDRAPDLPVVVLAPADDEIGALRAVAAGAQDYLVKGRAPGALIARVLRHAAERKRLQRALRESERMATLGQTLAGVAHELNNPIGAILHFVEVMLEERRTPHDLEALDIVRSQALRARAIVHDLLALSRGNARERRSVDVAAHLRRAARVLEAQIGLSGVGLALELAPALGAVDADWSAIEQVIVNLVVNAAQAAGRGGTVTVRAERTGTMLELTVDDDGPGIPPQLQSRIFDPYFTTKPTGEGTGLGLAVSLDIVRRLGGTLSAENRLAPSGATEGARFVVRLPAAASNDRGGADRLAPTLHPARPAMNSEVAGQYAGSAADAPQEPRAPRALIVDDEPSVRLALRRLFTRHAWRVDEVGDGTSGLRMVLDARYDADDPYDLVLCDLRMPGLSGIELHDTIAAEHAALLESFVFTTGDVASEDAADFIARAACVVLHKPFELSEVKALMARAEERR